LVDPVFLDSGEQAIESVPASFGQLLIVAGRIELRIFQIRIDGPFFNAVPAIPPLPEFLKFVRSAPAYVFS
jgi:hypothetical protein